MVGPAGARVESWGNCQPRGSPIGLERFYTRSARQFATRAYGRDRTSEPTDQDSPQT